MQRIGHLLPATSIGTERWAAQICTSLAIETTPSVVRAALPEFLYGPALPPSQSLHLTRGAELLRDAGVGAVVWSGTSGDLAGAAHGRLVARWIEEVTGVRASTTTLGQLDLLARHDITSLALITPGSAKVGARLADTYAGEGFKVASVTSLGLASAREAAELPVGTLRRALREADSLDARCLVVAGTELPVAPLAAMMERELGKPVYDGARVAVRTGLELLGLSVNSPGWGRLFAAEQHEDTCCAH